jgi:hypothetical protein
MGKYLDKIRQHEHTQTEEALTQQKALDQTPTVHSGVTIEWEGADMTVRQGVVDFLHTDTNGLTWAFVTLGKGWAAVNLKFATVRTDGNVLSTDSTRPCDRME